MIRRRPVVILVASVIAGASLASMTPGDLDDRVVEGIYSLATKLFQVVPHETVTPGEE